MAGAVELVRRFRDLRALVIGDVMLDSYLEGQAARICTEGPVPVVRKTAEERLPGGAANVAANLHALGAQVDLLGLTGQDIPALLLRSALRERGVDDRWLVADDQVTTLHKMRILAAGQYVVRFDEGATECCSPAGHLRLLEHFEAAFFQCDLVVISDYGYGAVSDPLLDRLRSLRASRPCVLVVDSKQLQRFRHAGATMITPNYFEARLIVAPEAKWDGAFDLAEVEQVGRQLLAKIDAEFAAITLAEDGVCLVGRDSAARHLPAHPVAKANDVGAGDSFTTAVALALAAGADPQAATRIAVDAAGIAVAKPQTAVVQHQELLQRVSLREHTTLRPAKHLSVDVLAHKLQVERDACHPPRTIVFTNGVWDILHAGHIEFLRHARQLGDILVVGVNTDRSARRLKGRGRPINGEKDRLALVAALEPVDHALLFDEDTPAELIRILRPDIHVKGGDYAGKELPEAEAVREVGGRIEIIPLVGGLSTSALIDRIIALARPATPMASTMVDEEAVIEAVR